MTVRGKPGSRPPGGRTDGERLIPGEPQDGGYRQLSAIHGEPHSIRAELAGVRGGLAQFS